MFKIFFILCLLTSRFSNTIDLSTYIQLGVTCVIGIIVLTIVLYITYKANPKQYKITNKKFKHLSDNPFENIFTLDAAKVGISGTFSYACFIHILRQLPMSVISTISPLYIILAMNIKTLI